MFRTSMAQMRIGSQIWFARIVKRDAEIGHDPARASSHHEDSLSQEDCFGDVVCHKQSGPAAVTPDAHEFLVQLLTEHIIKGREGFVEQ